MWGAGPLVDPVPPVTSLPLVLEVILEVLFELVFQGLLELLFDLGVQGAQHARRGQPLSPPLASMGYASFGAAIGGLSLLVFPTSFVTHGPARIVALFAGPLFAGTMMATLGWLLRRYSRRTTRLESFAYGFVFAFAVSLVRYFGTE